MSKWLAGDPANSNIGVPGGPIELDSTFNPGYSYRMIPDNVSFGDEWMELCDAAPCYIEDDPSAWNNNPNTWCPWAAQIRVVWDCSNQNDSDCGYPVYKHESMSEVMLGS